jgi:hypothetical protein
MRRCPVPTAIAVSVIALSLLCGGGTARSQDANPKTLAAARALVTTARLADNFKKIVPVMIQQLMQTLKPAIVQGRPEVDRDYDAMVPQMVNGMLAKSDLFIEGIARIYAKHFTVDELGQLTAFFRSPAGAKYIEQVPAITQESMMMGQSVGQEIGKDLQDRMIEELRKRGHKI